MPGEDALNGTKWNSLNANTQSKQSLTDQADTRRRSGHTQRERSGNTHSETEADKPTHTDQAHLPRPRGHTAETKAEWFPTQNAIR